MYPKVREDGAGTPDGWHGRTFGDVKTGDDPFGSDGPDPLKMAAKATTKQVALRMTDDPNKADK